MKKNILRLFILPVAWLAMFSGLLAMEHTPTVADLQSGTQIKLKMGGQYVTLDSSRSFKLVAIPGTPEESATVFTLGKMTQTEPLFSLKSEKGFLVTSPRWNVTSSGKRPELWRFTGPNLNAVTLNSSSYSGTISAASQLVTTGAATFSVEIVEPVPVLFPIPHTALHDEPSVPPIHPYLLTPSALLRLPDLSAPHDLPLSPHTPPHTEASLATPSGPHLQPPTALHDTPPDLPLSPHVEPAFLTPHAEELPPPPGSPTGSVASTASGEEVEATPPTKEEASVKIHAVARGFLARKRLAHKQEAATHIQALFRGHLGRQAAAQAALKRLAQNNALAKSLIKHLSYGPSLGRPARPLEYSEKEKSVIAKFEQEMKDFDTQLNEILAHEAVPAPEPRVPDKLTTLKTAVTQLQQKLTALGTQLEHLKHPTE